MQNPTLVLSLFPGVGLLDRAFEEAGFCVVRGPDVLWGGDIRRFRPPPDVFGGVIGGPPCQAFSSLKFIVEANGYQPRFGNLIPEFERCVSEARPLWFLMEEVPRAPVPLVDGYGVHSFVLNNRQFGAAQNRNRRISFGWRDTRKILLLETVALQNPRWEYAATGGAREIPVKIGGSGRLKTTAKRLKRRPSSCVGYGYRTRSAFRQICEQQGLPDTFELPGFTVRAGCEAVGNGIPLPMGRGLAAGVMELLQTEGFVSTER